MTIEDLLPEQTTPKQEQEPAKQEAPKEEKPKKPSVDHSIPVRERVIQERNNLKFEATIMGDMERQAAKILGDLLLWEFEHYPEREGEWDFNEWTLVDFLQAFAKKAREAVRGNSNQALFAGNTEDPNDPTMGLLRSIIETKNEPKKIEKPAEPTQTKAKPEPKKEKPKLTPKQEQDTRQLLLDLGL